MDTNTLMESGIMTLQLMYDINIIKILFFKSYWCIQLFSLQLIITL